MVCRLGRALDPDPTRRGIFGKLWVSGIRVRMELDVNS